VSEYASPCALCDLIQAKRAARRRMFTAWVARPLTGAAIVLGCLLLLGCIGLAIQSTH